MKIDKNAPIGVFDSGVGGLTVAREIMRNLPSEKIVYFGDTARVPYGQIKGNHYPVFQTDHSFSSGAAGEGGGDRM
mgnify:CR=1 FL=1